MIYLRLFLTFLKIGLVSFGGGYGMISMIRDDCLQNGWLTEDELLNFIAVAESTPGPIAVNMATFVGSSQGGFFGALLATLGVVTPSFVIILLIASIFTGLMKYGAVRATLSGIRPAIVSLILGTAATMLLSILLGISGASISPEIDLKAILIFAFIVAAPIAYEKWQNKKLSPIALIILSGILGIILY